MTLRIFYRNRSGKDTKVIWWTENLSAVAQNAYQLYADVELDEGDISYQSVDSRGAFTKKIVDGALVNRDQADIDKDRAIKEYLNNHCEEQIATIMQHKEKATWLMVAAENLYTYLDALQTVLAIDNSSLSVAGQQAKGTLAYIKTNIGDNVRAAMATRDAAIAALDVED